MTTHLGPDAEVPVFAADDERVNTAGFVGETLRLHRERDGVRYTLMAFAVGDTLTLGAMVKGAFDGLVRWKIGGRSLSFAFDSAGSLSEVPIEVEGEPLATVAPGQGAVFRGIAWVNVELPLAEWASDGTPVQLAFLPEIGAPLFLPDDGHHYRVRLARR